MEVGLTSAGANISMVLQGRNTHADITHATVSSTTMDKIFSERSSWLICRHDY